MKGSFDQWSELGWRTSRGIGDRCSLVSQDGRVKTVEESGIASTGLGANPIIIHWLVRIQLQCKISDTTAREAENE